MLNELGHPDAERIRTKLDLLRDPSTDDPQQ
jgi:hypothetical protein